MHGTQTKAAWRPSLDETERLLALAGGWRGESSRGKTQSEIARAIGIDVETFSSWLLKTRACIQSRPHTITSARFVMDLQKLEKRPPEIKDADARRIRERALKRAASLAAVLPTWPNAPLPPPNPILEIARDRRGGWQVGGKRRGQCGAYARRRDQEVDDIDDEPAKKQPASKPSDVRIIETLPLEFPMTLAAARASQGSSWAIGDALIQETGEPGPSSIKSGAYARVQEAQRFLADRGFPYSFSALVKLRHIAFIFRDSRRASFTICSEARTPELLDKIIADIPIGVTLTATYAREARIGILGEQRGSRRAPHQRCRSDGENNSRPEGVQSRNARLDHRRIDGRARAPRRGPCPCCPAANRAGPGCHVAPAARRGLKLHVQNLLAIKNSGRLI